jgi:hypothetical protein
VFHPLVASGTLAVKYSAWLRKFAASVCWRILEESFLENRLDHFHARWIPELSMCRETWWRYLNGKQPDVGGYHVHLLCEVLPRTAIGTNAGDFCSIEKDVFCGNREAFVYARLGPIILFGLIADPDPARWRGTRINAEGKLKPRDIFIPAQYREYIFSRSPRLS